MPGRFHTISVIRFFLLFILQSPFLSVKSDEVDREVIFSKDIVLEDGRDLGHIQILRGDEPADVIYWFGIEHELDNYMRKHLLNSICNIIECSRDFAYIWSTPVTQGDSFVENFVLREDVEPVDAAHEFVKRYNLPAGYRYAILREACEVVDCHRVHPGKQSIFVDFGERISVFPALYFTEILLLPLALFPHLKSKSFGRRR